MIDHTGLQVKDPTKSRKFYDKALSPLGYKMIMEIPKEHTGGAAVFGYGVPPKPDFWATKQNYFDGSHEPRLQLPIA